MDCAYFREAIHRYIDSELSDAEVVAFQRHLGFCAECAHTLQELSVVRSALRKSGRFIAVSALTTPTVVTLGKSRPLAIIWVPKRMSTSRRPTASSVR